jgi:hypothetical protein
VQKHICHQNLLSFSKDLLSAYYMLSIVFGTFSKRINEKDENLSSHGIFILQGEDRQ